MPKKQSGNRKNKQSNFAKLSIFQPNKYKFKKTCPLSVKGAPKIDYKNVKLLKKYVSENGKILPSRITNVSQKKQRELSLSIKGAPKIDYKNIRLLKKYISENGKILPSRITNVSQKKQRELSLSIKRARNLALI